MLNSHPRSSITAEIGSAVTHFDTPTIYQTQKGMHSHAFLFTCHIIRHSKINAMEQIDFTVSDGQIVYPNLVYTFNDSETFKSLLTSVNTYLMDNKVSTSDLIVNTEKVIPIENSEAFSALDKAQLISLIECVSKHKYEIFIKDIAFISHMDERVYDKLNPGETLMYVPEHSLYRWRDGLSFYESNVALSDGNVELTYGQIDTLSNKMANMLLDKGITKGDYVPVFMGRGFDIVISLLGIMKIGAVYVPMDPSYPIDRTHHILSELNPKYVLINMKSIMKVEAICKPLGLNTLLYQQATHYSDAFKYPELDPTDSAYVIYTSGSTGKPKGTILRHEGIVNLADNYKHMFELSEICNVAQFVSYNFDPSISDTFSALLSGATLTFLPEEARMDVTQFVDFISEKDITHITSLPAAFFNQLAEYVTENLSLGALSYIGIGGEALSVKAITKMQGCYGDKITYLNLYGPTECTVTSTYHTIDYRLDESVKSLPIGKPLLNFSTVVVDDDGNNCPIGMPGELFIHSVGLASGYLNNEAKTNEVFVQHLYKGINKRFYKTGDIVRLLPDGTLDYISRKDWQVKIRGHRIEIGEIENALLSCPGIKGVYVLPKEQEDGEKYLVAFYTSINDSEVLQSDIQSYLTNKIPSYMIPSIFQHLDVFKLTPTGKIDRKELENMDLNPTKTIVGFWEPTTDTEKMIIESWKRVLNVTNILPTSDFFVDLKGHSLKIMQSLIHLKPKFPFLGIGDFFLYPTVASMAAYLDKGKSEGYVAPAGIAQLDSVGLAEYPFEITMNSSITPLTATNILLTGATGFLGAHILENLLKTTYATVNCMVRDGNVERLKSVMMHFFGETILDYFSRVNVIAGDLSHPTLGLSDESFYVLTHDVDSIIHCAANVNHFGHIADFMDTNVNSTRFLLEVAKSRPGLRFHYISTMSVLEVLAQRGHNVEAYSSLSDFDTIDGDVYTSSKLLSEKLVEEFSRQGVHATIYRMGNLVGDSTTGKFQQNIDQNAFYRTIKAGMLLRRVPDVKWYVDLTPIDFAGQSVVKLMLDNSTVGKVLHICNPEYVEFSEFIDILNTLGYGIEKMPVEKYESWLLDSNEPKDHEGHELAITYFDGDGAHSSPFYFRSEYTQDYLGNSAKCIKPSAPYITKLITHAKDIGYMPNID